MSEAPLISVIITCHDLGAFVDEAVDSVLEQSCQDFEILIVDDGSSDEATVAILDGYDRPKTRVFRTANQGLAKARNFLIERARGEYLCALDADDRLHPEYFAKALAAFASDPGLCFVSSWLEAFGDEQWLWRQHRSDLAALLAEDTVMTAALVRRDAVDAVGGYDEKMPAPGDEDWDLWIRLVKAGHRGIILPEVLFYYRRRAGSMSTLCVEGETHLALVQYLLHKHREAYREHLDEVLMLKEDSIAELLVTNHHIETRLAGELRPQVERRRAELANLNERLQRLGASPRTHGFGGEVDAARAEVHALRTSWSWRITAPLRAIYDLILGRRP